MYKSLMARVVLVAVSLMTAILLFFLIANHYAMLRLRQQTVQAQDMALELYVSQMNDSLEELRISMVQRVNTDIDLNALCYYEIGSNDYMLSAQRCKKWLSESLPVNRLIASQYIYDARSGMLLTASSSVPGTRHLYIEQHIPIFTQNTGAISSSGWARLYTMGYINGSDAAGWLLIKCARIMPKVTLGTAISVNDLIPPLEEALTYEGMITQIYSDEGQLLAQSSRDGEIHKIRLSAEKLENGTDKTEDPETGEKYVLISRELDNAPLRVVTLLPEHVVFSGLQHFQAIGVLLPILIAVFAIGSAAVIPVLYRPFDDLIHIMEGVSAGDLSLRLPKGKTPEFRQVNAHFNRMVEKLDQLNTAVREQTLRTHRAELRRLQAQINPHFYQNMLNLIYNLAALKQYELIQTASLHLADYFRFIMRSGDQPVPLKDEMKHISNYMELQKIRYPGAIEYTCQADELLLETKIPPLLIQPFVENCMIHAFTTRRLFKIHVSIRPMEEGRICIEIRDNGKGVDEATLKELNRMTVDPDQELEKHIGIWNVVTRLRKLCGERFLLQFSSLPEQGTLVHMEFAFTSKEEGEAQ